MRDRTVQNFVRTDVHLTADLADRIGAGADIGLLIPQIVTPG